MIMRTLAVVAAIYASTCNAQGERELLARVDALTQQLSSESAEAPAGTLPNTCGAAPLPLTPVGPTVQATWQYATTTDTVTVIGWRLPCSAADSMVVLTLRPSAGTDPSFVCRVALTLLQAGGLQTNELNFNTDPSTSSSFCGDVIAPVTVAITPRSSTPASFDFDQGFTIDFDAYMGHQTLAMFAFDPSQYNITPPPGPDSVEVYVRGSGAHYRNCQVTTRTVGAGDQYSATCASESPLKTGGFDRYDY
jgi:hypothetical protein